MSSGPGTKVVHEIETSRTVGGIAVTVTESVWNGGGRSFDVTLDSTGQCLTEAESLDADPGDAQLAALLPASVREQAAAGNAETLAALHAIYDGGPRSVEDYIDAGATYGDLARDNGLPWAGDAPS